MPYPKPVDAGPTKRRLHQLLACGFTVEQIARAAGRPPQVVAVLPVLQWISPATASAVRDADEALLGPPQPDVAVDEVTVERLAAGEAPLPSYTRAERHEAVRRMRRRGLSEREMAARLHVGQRLVCRDLAALGLSEAS